MYTQEVVKWEVRVIDNTHRRKQVSFHEEVLNNMESHANHSLNTVLNSKVEIMELLRRQEANSSSTMQSQQSILTQLSADLNKIDRATSTIDKDNEIGRRLKIVDSLRFPNMHLRKDAIPRTYGQTFHWIFARRHRFRNWLEREDGIFWISG